jgi:ribosomal protein S18 acetylase RimI-like enzyme
MHAAFAAQAALTPPSGVAKETVESVTALLTAGGGFVAFSADVPVGSVIWRDEEADLYLGRLAVLPAARRQGVARALIAAVEELARQRGKPAVVLAVRLALPDNIRLFQSLGFIEIGRLSHGGFIEPTQMRLRKICAPGHCRAPAAGHRCAARTTLAANPSLT